MGGRRRTILGESNPVTNPNEPHDPYSERLQQHQQHQQQQPQQPQQQGNEEGEEKEQGWGGGDGDTGVEILVSLATETASEPLRMALAKVLRNIGRHANNRTRLYKVKRRRKRGNELCTVMYGAMV